MVVAGSGPSEGLLEAEGDEAGEEEGGEGDDVERHHVLRDFRPGLAIRVVGEPVVRISGVPGQPDEHGECEQGVDVYYSVQRRYVDWAAYLRVGIAGHFRAAAAAEEDENRPDL